MNNSLNQYSPMQTALALLQPTVSNAQKRADADRNLMLQSALTQQAQQTQEQARQQALLIQQQQAQLMNVPFLDRDTERWKMEIDKVKARIRHRLENDFGGDEEAYAKSMLEQDIQGLALDAQKSPLYKQSLERRANLLQAQKDAQDGKIYRPVTYRLTNGQQKTAPFDTAYLDFHNGETEELPYNGGFKVDGKWRKHFDDTYSPRVNKLGKFQPDKATPQEIASALVTTEGLTAQDAAEYMRRTNGMLAPIYYKFESRDPYKEEELRLRAQSNRISQQDADTRRSKLKLDQKISAGQIDAWDNTFKNPDNVITRTPDRQPGAINISVFDPSMNSVGAGKLQGFTGKWLGNTLLESTGATYDKKQGTYIGAGGTAYVAVKNNAGGLDLRSTDLSGLHYTTKPGNIFRYEDKPTEYERATNRKPYRHLQEQTILISSDEAKKAKAGKLFDRAVPNAVSRGMDLISPLNSTAADYLLGNADTPTGKGAYKEREIDGKKYYEFKILQPVDPTALDRQDASLQRMNTQGKVGQAILNDSNDDMGYY